MTGLPDGGEKLSAPLQDITADEVSMNLTMCGLLPEYAADLTLLYSEYGDWNQVKEVWFEESRGDRSTKDSSQKTYRVLVSRYKNAPSTLPNPSDLPNILNECTTTEDKAQVLYPYLVADDTLFQYVIRNYAQRLNSDILDPLDFSNETLIGILDDLEYTDGGSFDYAESTTTRWCEGFRSVMREIGVLESSQSLVGQPPSVGDIPLLVSTGYSYEEGDDSWLTSPIGLQYLFQPESKLEELYDRVAETDAWEFLELHGSLELRPIDDTYSWIPEEEIE